MSLPDTLAEAVDMAYRAGLAQSYYGLDEEEALARAVPYSTGREALEADVQAFLAAGGAITEVPMGVTTLDYEDGANWLPGSTLFRFGDINKRLET